MTTIEVHAIEPTRENAATVQQLTYNYYEAGNFPKPHRFADPENEKLVNFQKARLEIDPGNYTGVHVNGDLAGFLKTEEWTAAHVLAFTTKSEHDRLMDMRNKGLDIVGTEKLAIAAFVIDQERAGDLYEESTEYLLDVVTDKAIERGKAAINAAFYETDPLSAMARKNGFEFTGRIAHVPTHQGVLHRLYTKPLDY